MSNDAITYVLDHKDHSGTNRMILFVMADRANADWRVWASIEYIAKRANVSERTAQRAIRQLEKSGSIAVVSRGGNGPRDTTTWCIKGDTTMSPLDVSRMTGNTSKGDTTMSPLNVLRVTNRVSKGDTCDTQSHIPHKRERGEGGENTPLGSVGGELPEVTPQTPCEGQPQECDQGQPTCEGYSEVAARFAQVFGVTHLTDVQRKGIENMVKGYSAGEVLTALDIAAQKKGEPINRPFPYLYKVLKGRVTRMVDQVDQGVTLHRQPVAPSEPDQGDPGDPGDPVDYAAQSWPRVIELIGERDKSLAEILAGTSCSNGNGHTVTVAGVDPACAQYLGELGKVEILRYLQIATGHPYTHVEVAPGAPPQGATGGDQVQTIAVAETTQPAPATVNRAPVWATPTKIVQDTAKSLAVGKDTSRADRLKQLSARRY